MKKINPKPTSTKRQQQKRNRVARTHSMIYVMGVRSEPRQT